MLLGSFSTLGIHSAQLIDKLLGRNESPYGLHSFVPKHTSLWAETKRTLSRENRASLGGPGLPDCAFRHSLKHGNLQGKVICADTHNPCSFTKALQTIAPVSTLPIAK